MAGGTDADPGDEVDPASRRLVFWLEMENNMLRERVEESSLLADAVARVLENCIRDPTPQHLEWARECAACVHADPRLEKLFAEVEQTRPVPEREANPGSPRGTPSSPRSKNAKTSPVDADMAPGSPRSFSERAVKRKDDEAQAAKQRASASRFSTDQARRGSKPRTVIPSSAEVDDFPQVRLLEVRGLPKQLAGQALNVGNHEIDDVVEVEATQDSDGTAMCRLGRAVRVQGRGGGDPETWAARITVRLGAQVVCKTGVVDPSELPARGSEPFSIPFYGKQKGRDGTVTTVQQGLLVATLD